MTFWLLATLMCVLALAFVLPPLWQRTHAAADPAQRRRLQALADAHAAGVLDDAEYQAKREALGSGGPAAAVDHGRPWVAFALVALFVPLGAALLYARLGEPDALDPAMRDAPRQAAAAGDGAAPMDMERAVAGLAERLRNEPDNLEGWLLLGRAYKSMERFEPARTALAQAARLAPDDPDVMIEYAEAMALASPGRRFAGESLALLQRATTARPDHQRGIWLLGIAAMQAGEPQRAIGHWERLQALLADDAEARDSLQQQIDGARAQLADGDNPRVAVAPASGSDAGAAGVDDASEAVAPPAAGSGSAGGDGTAPRLTVNVDISPALRASLRPSDVLFVYARAPEGPRMPLAIQRMPAAKLPVTVVLDDSTSMMPQLTLSSLPQVVVGARVSRSGQAMPQPGDLEATSPPLPVGRREPLRLLIDSVVP